METKYAPAIILLVASIFLSVIVVSRVDQSDRQVAVLFPPGREFVDNVREVAGAGGRVLRVGASDDILVVEIDNPKTLLKLRRSSAIAVFNPRVTGACSAFSPNFDRQNL